MPVSWVERKMFSNQMDDMAEQLVNLGQDHGLLLFKIWAAALGKERLLMEDGNDKLLADRRVFKEKYRSLLQDALHLAGETGAGKTPDDGGERNPDLSAQEYSPRQLSLMFGVSVTSIHNWIAKGRFEGVKLAGDGKHNLISGDAIYRSPSGKRWRVSDIAREWEHSRNLQASNGEKTDNSLYARQIAMFEEKYKGAFKDTIAKKSAYTIEEHTDLQIWRALLDQREREKKAVRRRR